MDRSDRDPVLADIFASPPFPNEREGRSIFESGHRSSQRGSFGEAAMNIDYLRSTRKSLGGKIRVGKTKPASLSAVMRTLLYTEEDDQWILCRRPKLVCQMLAEIPSNWSYIVTLVLYHVRHFVITAPSLSSHVSPSLISVIPWDARRSEACFNPCEEKGPKGDYYGALVNLNVIVPAQSCLI